MGDQIRIPCVVITFFFFFFFPSFSQAIFKTAEHPALCNVVPTIYHLFVPHFATSVFVCIYLHYCQRGGRPQRVGRRVGKS